MTRTFDLPEEQIKPFVTKKLIQKHTKIFQQKFEKNYRKQQFWNACRQVHLLLLGLFFTHFSLVWLPSIVGWEAANDCRTEHALQLQ